MINNLDYSLRLAIAMDLLSSRFPAEVWRADIYHDDDCGMAHGGELCACMPEITMKNEGHLFNVGARGEPTESQ